MSAAEILPPVWEGPERRKDFRCQARIKVRLQRTFPSVSDFQYVYTRDISVLGTCIVVDGKVVWLRGDLLNLTFVVNQDNNVVRLGFHKGKVIWADKSLIGVQFI